MHNCEIIPTGMYRPVDEKRRLYFTVAGEIEIDPEYVLPDTKEDLGKVENWVHFNPFLLKGGRSTHYVPKHLSEDAAAELRSALEEKDPQVDRLRSLTEDKRNLVIMLSCGSEC